MAERRNIGRRVSGIGKRFAVLSLVALLYLCLGSVQANAATARQPHSHASLQEHHRRHHHRRRHRDVANALRGLAPAPAAQVPGPPIGIEPYSPHPSELRPYEICPPPTKTRVSCLAIGTPNRAKLRASSLPVPHYEGSGVEGGFSPSDLRSAYDLPSTGGKGLTVAITIAYDDPKAEEDLATYRSHYGLSTCTTANGCFKKVNQKGEAGSYPKADAEWAAETSLDLDMVSAICPECKILLVEANSNFSTNLFPAVEKAAEMGANVISDSWGGYEAEGEVEEDPYFHHPGTPVLFASGDEGYTAEYPAASPDVVAVGGTSLRKEDTARGWWESAWSGAGSGCSEYEEKPVWQADEGCANRTIADVSAVAAPATPVSVYDSYGYGSWRLFGGTSVATPIVAGVEALSSGGFRSLGPEAFYAAAEAGELFDVTEGRNEFCGSYLCEAGPGYDGPTGEGTPDGALSISNAITEAATNVSMGEATLHGTVNPSGKDTSYHFEYGTSTSYGTSAPVPSKGIGKGEEGVAVSQTIKSLAARHEYHFRVVATDSEGVDTYGADRTFAMTAPSATTEAASEVHANDAVLHALVDPEGASTRYQLEYGTTTAYGASVPFPPEGIGAGTTGVSVSRQLGGLTGEATYHYRVKATNAAGTTYGKDRSFTTPPSQWQVQVTADPPDEGPYRRLKSVSCASAADCVAVGTGGNDSTAIAEHRQGATWSLTQLPNLEAEFGERVETELLSKVSCASSTICFAVGNVALGWPEPGKLSALTRPLVERWNGSEWSLEAAATSLGSKTSGLNAVSCPSSSYCIAVGYEFSSSENKYHTFAETWNGKGWSTTAIPDPPKYEYNVELKDISCTSPSSCMAVGSYRIDSSTFGGLAETWNGKEWSITSVPALEGANSYDGELTDVSCSGEGLAAMRCLAINLFSTWAWNGVEWAVVGGPPLPIDSTWRNLSDVSCATTTECTVVGDAFAENHLVPLAAGWNGSEWSLQSTSDPMQTMQPVGYGSAFQEVSCLQSYGCEAVGDRIGSRQEGLDNRTLAEYFAAAPRFKEINVLPTLDALTRTESPLSNGGKWSALSWATNATGHPTGKDTETGWGPYDTLSAGADGAYWNPSTFSDKTGDAAALTMQQPGGANSYMALWLDMGSPGSSKSGYQLRWTGNSDFKTYTVKLSKWSSGKETVLASNASVTIPAGTTMAISDTGGTVTAWQGTGGSLTSTLSASDTTFGEGYAGIEGLGNFSRWKNFKAGRLLGGAIGGVTVLDDFGREEFPLETGQWTKTAWAEGIGDSWTSPWHGYGASANGVHLVGAYWNPTTFSDAKGPTVVAATLGTGPTAAGEYLSLWLDMPSPGSARSGYEARFTGTNGSESAYKVELAKWVSGIRTVLGTQESFSLPKNTTFALTETGGSLALWTGTSNLSPVLSATDSTYSSGYAGLEAYKGEGTEYDFRAGGI